MDWLRTFARKYAAAAGIALRGRLAYPADIAGPLFSFAVFVSIFALIWTAAVPEGARVAGYSRAELIWYFMFAEVVVFAGGSVFPSLAAEIRDGQVAYTLGRPYSWIGFNLSQYLGVLAFQLPVFLAVGGIICFAAAGPWLPVAVWQLPVLLAAILLGAMLKFFLNAVFALTAFWLEDNTAFFWILSKITLVTGTLMPLEFLPDWLQGPMAWTPFPWVSWAAASLAIHPDPGAVWFKLGGLAAWTAVLAFASVVVFRAGARDTVIQGG